MSDEIEPERIRLDFYKDVFAPHINFDVDNNGNGVDPMDLIRLLVKIVKDNNLHERQCNIYRTAQHYTGEPIGCSCTMRQIHVF